MCPEILSLMAIYKTSYSYSVGWSTSNNSMAYLNVSQLSNALAEGVKSLSGYVRSLLSQFGNILCNPSTKQSWASIYEP